MGGMRDDGDRLRRTAMMLNEGNWEGIVVPCRKNNCTPDEASRSCFGGATVVAVVVSIALVPSFDTLWCPYSVLR